MQDMMVDHVSEVRHESLLLIPAGEWLGGAVRHKLLVNKDCSRRIGEQGKDH